MGQTTVGERKHSSKYLKNICEAKSKVGSKRECKHQYHRRAELQEVLPRKPSFGLLRVAFELLPADVAHRSVQETVVSKQVYKVERRHVEEYVLEVEEYCEQNSAEQVVTLADVFER